MRRFVPLLLATVAFAGPVEDAAEKALAAHRLGDAGALKLLAEKDDPDPWLVADELCARGEHDAADAFARAAPRKDVEKLPAYVAAGRSRTRDPKAREALAALNRALQEGKPEAALRAVEASMADGTDVVSVRLATGRGIALRALRRLEESAAAFRETALASERLGWLARAATGWHETGLSSWERSDFRAALSSWERRLVTEESRGDRRGIAAASWSIAAARGALSDYARSLESYERALTLYTELDDRASMSAVLCGMGNVHWQCGDDRRSLECQEQALRLSNETADRLGAARALGSLGTVHSRLGDDQRALNKYEAALRIFEELGDTADVATTLGNIAVVQKKLGSYVIALDYQQKALKLHETTGNRAGVARALRNMGDIHLSLGDFPRALDCEQRALELCEAIGDRAGIAHAVGSIGSIHEALGDHPGALKHAERSLAICLDIGDRAGMATTLGNIGNIHLWLRDYSRALDCQERALELKRERGDRDGIARTLGNIGLIHYRLRDYARALEYEEQALALKKERGDQIEIARTLGNIGLIHCRLGDYPRSLSLYEEVLELARLTGDREMEIRSLWGLSDALSAAGRPAEALSRARDAVALLSTLGRGLDEEEGASLRQHFADVFESGARAGLAESDTAAVTQFVEGGRAATLLEGLGGRQRIAAHVLSQGLREAEAEARARERAALVPYRRALDAGEPAEALWKDVESSREAVVAVARRIRREAKAPADLAFPEAASLDRILGSLSAGDTLVLYALYEKDALAIIATRSAARVVRLGATVEIIRAAAALQTAAERPDLRGVASPPHEGFEYLAKRLRKLVLEPLKLDPKTTRLLVSPDGPLAYVPFGALVPQEVAYLPSATTYLLLCDSRAARGARVLALGDPDYTTARDRAAVQVYGSGEQMEPLPASGDEARAIGDVVLLGKHATVAALQEALPREARWRAVHFACHGLIDPERPLLSSLALTPGAGDDGFLKCLDVYRMRVPADLVVLSGCETVKGKAYKAEGVIGFVRAFMMAGSPRVLASLWKVDDRATGALMAKFYELWKPGKLSAAAALKAAQEHVASSREEWRHPYYWAAWQLWGLPE